MDTLKVTLLTKRQKRVYWHILTKILLLELKVRLYYFTFQVVGKNNIWTQVAYSHQHSPMADMDWSEMEGLFCQQIPPSSAQSSPKLGNRDNSEVIERRMRKDITEVTLESSCLCSDFLMKIPYTEIHNF